MSVAYCHREERSDAAISRLDPGDGHASLAMTKLMRVK